MAFVEDPGYALISSSGAEHERLLRQADRYAPYTRRLLISAAALESTLLLW